MTCTCYHHGNTSRAVLSEIALSARKRTPFAQKTVISQKIVFFLATYMDIVKVMGL